MAVVVETKELLETVVASLVAGVGVTVVFSVAIWGAPASPTSAATSGRWRRARRRRWPAWRWLVTLAAVVFGIVVMTSK